MATKTAGTLATTTLTAVQFNPDETDTGQLLSTDLATIALGITRDPGSVGATGGALGHGFVNAGGDGNRPGIIQSAQSQPALGPTGVLPPATGGASILPGAVTRQGLVTLPGGRTDTPITAQPGDWICNDGFGNLFVIPQRALPKTLTLANCTTTNNSPALAFPSSIWTLGWQVGTHVTGTNIPAGCVLGDITPNGLSANLYSFATGLKVNATGSSGAVTITAGTFTHS